MNILITGAGGMIGTHLTNKLKQDGHFIVGVDIKHNEFILSTADIFLTQDLTDQAGAKYLFDMCPKFDWVFNLAAVMGGMEYLANGTCDYKVLNESTLINWNVLDNSIRTGVKKIFFSSSACAYNMTLQESPDVVALKESDAYPVLPDLEYGYQKLISERIHSAAGRTEGIEVRIARFHNIYGPYTEWNGIKTKAPAALCRKVAEISPFKYGSFGEEFGLGGIDVIGDGLQTRSFTYIDDCITGILLLMESEYSQPINIGSDELISINDLAKMIIGISGKNLTINNIDGPQGVRGRNSDNTLIKQVLNWSPAISLAEGIPKLYEWVKQQVDASGTK